MEMGGSGGCLQPAPQEVQHSGGKPVNTGKLTAESGYQNPAPLVHLLGHPNETKIVVEGVEMKALVDTVSQISALTEGFCIEMGQKILPLWNLIRGVLHLEEIGGISILYKGYVEANLTIQDLPQYL